MTVVQNSGSVSNEATPASSEESKTGPRDGGLLGWFVVLGAFVCSMFVFGVYQAIGPIFIALQKGFNETSAGVSWIMSLMVLLQFGLGPVAAIVVKKIGYRMTVMIGSILSTFGFFLSAFTPNIEFLYFSIGILVGIGYSLIVPPALGIPALFIRKRFTIASAIVTAGGGIGTIVFPPVIQKLIDNYGWRGAFILFSAMNAHMCVSAALFRRYEHRQSSGCIGDTRRTSTLELENQVCATEHRRSTEYMKACIRVCDCGLFTKYPSFLILTLASFFAIGLGTYGSPAHFVARAESQNLGTLQEIALITSLFGIGSTFGRLVPAPLLLHFKCQGVTSSMLYGITFILAGITNHLSVLAKTNISYSVFAVFYGIFNGMYFTLFPVSVKDILSPEYLTTGVGLSVAVPAIGGLIGPICGGKLYDVTGNYDYSFHFYGASLIVGGVIMLLDKPLTHLGRSTKKKMDGVDCESHITEEIYVVDSFTQTGIN